MRQTTKAAWWVQVIVILLTLLLIPAAVFCGVVVVPLMNWCTELRWYWRHMLQGTP